MIFEKAVLVGGKLYDTTVDGFICPQGYVFLAAVDFDKIMNIAEKYNVGYLYALQGSKVH